MKAVNGRARYCHGDNRQLTLCSFAVSAIQALQCHRKPAGLLNALLQACPSHDSLSEKVLCDTTLYCLSDSPATCWPCTAARIHSQFGTAEDLTGYTRRPLGLVVSDRRMHTVESKIHTQPPALAGACRILARLPAVCAVLAVSKSRSRTLNRRASQEGYRKPPTHPANATR